jgi:hypothetical protein
MGLFAEQHGKMYERNVLLLFVANALGWLMYFPEFLLSDRLSFMMIFDT